jgi:hypothetical protein
MYSHLTICGSRKVYNEFPSSFASTVEIEDRKEFTVNHLQNLITDIVYRGCNPYENDQFINKWYRVENMDLANRSFEIYCNSEKVWEGYFYWTSWANIKRYSKYE